MCRNSVRHIYLSGTSYCSNDSVKTLQKQNSAMSTEKEIPGRRESFAETTR